MITIIRWKEYDKIRYSYVKLVIFQKLAAKTKQKDLICLITQQNLTSQWVLIHQIL